MPALLAAPDFDHVTAESRQAFGVLCRRAERAIVARLVQCNQDSCHGRVAHGHVGISRTWHVAHCISPLDDGVTGRGDAPLSHRVSPNPVPLEDHHPSLAVRSRHTDVAHPPLAVAIDHDGESGGSPGFSHPPGQFFFLAHDAHLLATRPPAPLGLTWPPQAIGPSARLTATGFDAGRGQRGCNCFSIPPC